MTTINQHCFSTFAFVAHNIILKRCKRYSTHEAPIYMYHWLKKSLYTGFYQVLSYWIGKIKARFGNFYEK